MSVPGLTFNPMMLLHGEQHLQLHRPIPSSGTLTSQARLAGIYDKGKATLVHLEARTTDASGQLVCTNHFMLFIRGIGGFGGERGPAQESFDPPKGRAPDAVVSHVTNNNQALLYRLSGDLNPLHADPSMAAMGGFDRPILHGLCSFGHAGRAIIDSFCDGDGDRLKSIRVRFSKHVFLGQDNCHRDVSCITNEKA
jgi:acyl dehydratase